MRSAASYASHDVLKSVSFALGPASTRKPTRDGFTQTGIESTGHYRPRAFLSTLRLLSLAAASVKRVSMELVSALVIPYSS